MIEPAEVSAILRRPQVEQRTGLSGAHIYAMMSRGEFPRPVKLSKKAVGWPTHVVDAWLRTRQTQAA